MGFNAVLLDLPFNNIESHPGLIQSNLLPSLLLLRDHEWGLAEFATTSPSFSLLQSNEFMPEIQGKKRALTGLPSKFQVPLGLAAARNIAVM